MAVIAAHDEEESISAALCSLREQTRAPDWIVVVADRCTDRTVDIALAFGAHVFETVGNNHRKAGALNQALAAILPNVGESDMVLMMDADTVLNPVFIAEAELRLKTREKGRPEVGAVGAVFHAHEPVGNLAQALQRNEYLRYAHDLHRRRGRAEVISGTAGLFPVAVLRRIAAERGQRLPAGGYVYSDTALTEDNELTTAVKSLGYRCASPAGCTVRTEIMPTVRTLYYQRLRWQRGALDTLRSYGPSRATAPYLLRQLSIHLWILFLPFFVTVVAIHTAVSGRFPWSWPWFLVSLLVVAERIWTVRAGGRRAMLLSALVIPDVLYDMFIHVVFMRALIESLANAGARWDHAEARQAAVPGAVIRILRVAGQVAIPVQFVGAAVLAALIVSLLGVQWAVVSILVGAGIAHSVLRSTYVDPLGAILGSCENKPRHRVPAAEVDRPLLRQRVA